MNTGIIYNIMVCFMAGGSGLLVAFNLFKIRKEKRIFWSKGLDYFLLLFGMLWILVGVRNIFFLAGYQEIDSAMWGYVVGPLTYLHILPLFYFYSWSFFRRKNEHRILFYSFFSVTTALAIIFLFINGFELSEMTRWGTKYDANAITHNIFTYGIFIPSIFFVSYEIRRRIITWRATNSFYEKQLLAFNIGILLYAIVAVFDGLALAKGATLLLVRVGIMISALIIYYFATEDVEDYE